jgi:uncharacterized protein YlaI
MGKTPKCRVCETKIDKDAIGLNKKLMDKKLTQYLCLECLSGHLDVSVEDLIEKAAEFKEQGCKLFF